MEEGKRRGKVCEGMDWKNSEWKGRHGRYIRNWGNRLEEEGKKEREGK